MPRVLLLATTTGYQTRAFGDAAERLGVDLMFATDRCNMLQDPWRDEALPIRFFDEAGAVSTIIEASRKRPIPLSNGAWSCVKPIQNHHSSTRVAPNVGTRCWRL